VKTTADEPSSKEEAIKEIYEEVRENKPVIAEDLRKVWSDYIAERRKANKPYEIVILNQDYSFENNIVKLRLSNPVQLEQLNGFKTELLSYLRKKLQNYDLDIDSEIMLEEETKIVYTSSDKFNYLAKKNPALLELKHKLGLDIDY
jgi:DNA polymerase III subunit gamma/tau